MSVTAAYIVASALYAGLKSAQGNLNAATNRRKQNAAAIRKLEQQWQYDIQNFYNNKSAISQQKVKNSFLIEENKLEAQDIFAQAFAGSGVSGRSVNLINSDITSEVSKSHNENLRQSTEHKDRFFVGLQRKSQGNIQNIKNLPIFDTSAAEANNSMAALEAGAKAAITSYTMGAFDTAPAAEGVAQGVDYGAQGVFEYGGGQADIASSGLVIV